MNSQSLPRFPRTNSLTERKIGVKIWHNNLGCISLALWIVRTYIVFLEFVEQKENQGKDWTLQVMILTLAERIVTIYPVFLESIEQIGVKIGYGKVVILSTCRINCHNLLRVSRVDWENGKLGWRLDLAC